jgi:hypothetical protein
MNKPGFKPFNKNIICLVHCSKILSLSAHFINTLAVMCINACNKAFFVISLCYGHKFVRIRERVNCASNIRILYKARITRGLLIYRASKVPRNNA